MREKIDQQRPCSKPAECAAHTPAPDLRRVVVFRRGWMINHDLFYRIRAQPELSCLRPVDIHSAHLSTLRLNSMERPMKIITGALIAPLLYLGLTVGASAAMGAPAHPQGLSSPPPATVAVRHVNRGHHYGWTRGHHRGWGHVRPPHARRHYPR